VRMKWLVVLGGALLIGILLYSTLQQTRYHYEVCVTFQGQSHCATAAGRTREEAIRSAQEIDCTLLANGRDENMVCLDSTPSSIQAVSKK
jgi:hypothetical protein